PGKDKLPVAHRGAIGVNGPDHPSQAETESEQIQNRLHESRDDGKDNALPIHIEIPEPNAANPPPRGHSAVSFSVGPTVPPTGGTPASPASLIRPWDGPPTPSSSVGPTVPPTGGTPAAPASLIRPWDGPPTPSSSVGPTVPPTG